MSEYIVTCDEETAAWIGNDVDSMWLIVHCHDCRFKAKDGNWCYRTDHEFVIEHDGFCSWGQAKDDVS